MNKKLLVLALAGAFVAPAAMADVTISGTINTGPQIGTSSDATATGSSNSVATSASAKGFSSMGLTSNYSNVNLNSTEDIGDGNKVVFNAQLDFSNTGSTVHDVNGNLKQRNTYIGFEGGWGSLRMGINEHIYERYMYASDVLDGAAGIGGNLQMLGTPGYGGVFDVGNSGCNAGNGCAGFYRRSGQSIWYDSPDIGGITFGVGIGLNAYQTSSTGPKPTFWSAGAQFKPADSPFFVNAAIEKHSDFFGLNAITNVAGATSSSDTGMQLGGGVTFGDISLYARWESLKYKSDGLAGANLNEYKRDAIWLGAKYNLATGYVGLQIGQANDGKCKLVNGAACNANDSGAFMLSGGYAHNLSKQTQLLIFGSMTNNDKLASYVNIGSPSAGVGSDGKSIALLVKHSF
jgi:predicted porin